MKLPRRQFLHLAAGAAALTLVMSPGLELLNHRRKFRDHGGHVLAK